MSAVLGWDEAAALCAAARAAGKRIVFTNGCFDILHAGHVALLEAARREGDLLVVGLNADLSVRRLKGPGRPLNNEQDRGRVLAALRAVDAVVIFPQDTPAELIARLAPDVLVKGGDYTVETIVGADFVQARGGRVAVIPLVEGRATTALVNKIRASS